ncbi:FAD-dependent oxidoreductase [Microbacterium esteraromaticum]|uniref:FAD-dependent oxidoreductase n=1 Tax=Microbacterium esteraromaticum TaxID=57043 RepID=UPI001C93C9EC|nr:FAD-dependent oxidoreductase [Microbacterium esteraromaticum]MBY6062392.1 FAD-dependent oxidoreductase [Microbacterium esteraromaticum]
MSETVDFVVVGGGAMGSAAAWHLARRGVNVVLIDQFEWPHTRGASHGTSRNLNLLQANREMIDLACESQRWIQTLEESTGLQLIDQTGILVHGPAAPEADKIAFFRECGLDVQDVPLDEAAQRWAGFRVDTRAVWNPDSGRLNLEGLITAMRADTLVHGGVIRSHERVSGISVLGEDRVEVALEGGAIITKKVIVAAGAWTADLLDGIVALPPLTVTQEQPAHFPVMNSEHVWPSFMHKRDVADPKYRYWHSDTYGMLTPGQGVKIGWHAVGKIVHPDRRDFLPEAGQLQALRDYAEEWMPGLDFRSPDVLSCTYTTPPDSTFILDSHGPLTIGAGFSGTGAKFTGAIGRVLADLAMGAPAASASFSLQRFM